MPRKSAQAPKPKKPKLIGKEPDRYIKAPKLVVSKKNGKYKIFASIPEDKKMIELKY